jgi:hypothetical protein
MLGLDTITHWFFLLAQERNKFFFFLMNKIFHSKHKRNKEHSGRLETPSFNPEYLQQQKTQPKANYPYIAKPHIKNPRTLHT